MNSFRTSFYPKNITYYTHFSALAKLQRKPLTTLLEEIMIEWLDQNHPPNVPLTTYAKEIKARPPLPWETRKNIVTKLKGMEKSQIKELYDAATKYKEIVGTILDDIERLEDA